MTDKRGFWSGIPGLITGLGALLTGIVGIVGIMAQVGVFDSGETTTTTTTPGTATTTTTVPDESTTVVTNRSGSTAPRRGSSDEGTVGAVGFTVTPSNLTFSQLVKSGSVTVTNTGTKRLIFAQSLDGEAFLASGCSDPLDPADNCQIEVRFAPSGSGNHTGTLTMTASGDSSTVALQGANLL